MKKKICYLLKIALFVAMTSIVNSFPLVPTATSNSGTAHFIKETNSSADSEEADILYELNSVIAGFREAPEAGSFESSAFGGLVSDLIKGDKPKDTANETPQNQTGGFGLLNLVRTLSTPLGKDKPKSGIGGFDILSLMRGFGMGSASFPALLAAFGLRRDQNTPGGSAPGGGSYDLTKLMASMGQKEGPNTGSNLGLMGGGLGALVNNVQQGGGGLKGILANFLGGR